MRYRFCDSEGVEALARRMSRQSHVFPHQVFYLPKCGPDGLELANEMYGLSDPSQMYQVQVYADSSLLKELPTELFFDDEVNWRRQQFGMPGLIGTANAICRGDRLYTTVRLSDLVQRIGRRRDYKTRVENVFSGWNELLLNALLSFAAERGLRQVVLPKADFALRHAGKACSIKAEMFERVYDRAVSRQFRTAEWRECWTVNVDDNRDRFYALPAATRPISRPERLVCIVHDTERELGHIGIDPTIENLGVGEFNRRLERMLEIECSEEVRATYSVVGVFLDEIRDVISSAGHALAFHSFDHRRLRPQLLRCRQVDYRIKGYRPPQSRMTWELSAKRLCRRNFEWLATSSSKLGGAKGPEVRAGLVYAPIFLDDFPLYKGTSAYLQWEADILDVVAGQRFAAIGLHDCYADRWLHSYRDLLRRLRQHAETASLDQVAAWAFLGTAV